MKKTQVHILATVRNPALLAAATLVFKSLRTGFPADEFEVQVWGNGLEPRHEVVLAGWTKAVGGVFRNLPGYRAHDAWIEELVQASLEPFWICDTDIIFFAPLRGANAAGDPSSLGCSDAASPAAVRGNGPIMKGRFEPEFMEEWTGTRYMCRLHTCVLWLDPVAIRSGMRAWVCRFPKPWRSTAEFPFIRQTFVPHTSCGSNAAGGPAAGERLAGTLAPPGRRTEVLFYDTCAGLYHALGGERFSEVEDAAFEHLHCATYVDCMDQGLPWVKGLAAEHQAIYEDPSRARGLRLKQREFYGSREPKESLCRMHQE